MSLHLSSTRVPDLIRSAVEEVGELARKKGLELRVSVTEFPEVWIDPERVLQVVLNLLSNAIKFTDRGFIELHSAFDLEKERLEISVRDTGIGIAPQDHETIFLEFRQLDGSATRRHGGTGLGLAICKAIVDSHNGSLQVSSQPGVGSIFRLRFPLQ